MACTCPKEAKKKYYATPTLYSSNHEGLPGDAGILLNQVEITVCTKCGKAEFYIPSDKRHMMGIRP